MELNSNGPHTRLHLNDTGKRKKTKSSNKHKSSTSTTNALKQLKRQNYRQFCNEAVIKEAAKMSANKVTNNCPTSCWLAGRQLSVHSTTHA